MVKLFITRVVTNHLGLILNRWMRFRNLFSVSNSVSKLAKDRLWSQP